MGVFGKRDPINEAIVTAERARGVLQSLDRNVATVQSELDRIGAEDARSALAAIEAGTEPEVSDAAIRLAAKREALLRARPAAVAKGIGSISSIYITAAGVARSKAVDLHAQSEKIVDATRGPLAKLSELESVSYNRSILLSQMVAGGWFKKGSPSVPADEGDGIMDVVQDFLGSATCALPKSSQLALEASKYEAAARDLEQKAANLVGEDLDALLTAALSAVGRAEPAQQAA